MTPTEAERFAQAIIQALREADEVHPGGGWVDDADLSYTCIDGWYNLERVAEKLADMGYGPSPSSIVQPSLITQT